MSRWLVLAVCAAASACGQGGTPVEECVRLRFLGQRIDMRTVDCAEPITAAYRVVDRFDAERVSVPRRCGEEKIALVGAEQRSIFDQLEAPDPKEVVSVTCLELRDGYAGLPGLGE